MVANIFFSFQQQIDFRAFIFDFASSAPFYNTGSHTSFCEILFLGLILEREKKKLSYTVLLLGLWTSNTVLLIICN